MTFALIIKLVLLGIAVISAISYMIERSGHKVSLKETLTKEPIRQLTGEELSLLQPYLIDKTLVRPYKYQPNLVNHNVFLLSGDCIKHSLTTNGAVSSYYYVIGDVEVFFPYNMENFTTGHNIAEVVFTPKYAFVLNLNGFSLVDAKTEKEEGEKREESWQSGVSGQFKSLTDDDIADTTISNIDNNTVELLKKAASSRCEIVRQREETPSEMETYSQLNTGFLCATSLIITVILLLCYIDSSAYSANGLLLIFAAICLIASLFFYVKKRTLTPRKINHVRGTLLTKNIDDHSIIVGDTLSVKYPKYWEQAIPATSVSDIDIDVRVEDREIVRFGHTLSLEQEVQDYGKPAFWGRNCFLFIVGAILTIFSLCFVDSISDSYKYVMNTLTNHNSKLVITENQQINSTLKLGDWLDISLDAQCSVKDLPNCRTVYIDVKPLDNEKSIENKLPAPIEAIMNNQLLPKYQDEDTKSYEGNLRLLKQLTNITSSNYYYQSEISIFKIKEVDKAILAVDELCQSGINNRQCEETKEDFIALSTGSSLNEKGITWKSLVSQIKNGLKIDDIMVHDSYRTDLLRGMNLLAADYASELGKRVYVIDLRRQRDTGIAISIDAETVQTSTQLPTVGRLFKDWHYSDIKQLAYYLALYNQQADLPFKVSGMLTNIEYTSNGSVQSLTVNPDLVKQKASGLLSQAHITVLLTLLLGLFTFSQLVICIIKARRNKIRIRRIVQDRHTYN